MRFLDRKRSARFAEMAQLSARPAREWPHGEEHRRQNIMDAPDQQADLPPWEQPDGFRRDYEPHRATALLRLAIVGIVLNFLGVVLVAFPTIVGVPVCLTIWLLARQDLHKMEAGIMDPSGNYEVMRALEVAQFGVVVGALAVLTWSSVVFLRLWQ